MRQHYDESLNAFIRRCPHCGYQHIEPFCIDKLSDEEREYMYRHTGDKPFIEGVAKFMHKVEHSYAPSTIEEKTVYACPNCGILQINP